MENPCIKSEPEEYSSQEGLFVIQGIKVEENEQRPADIKLEFEENDLNEEDAFSKAVRNDENCDSSFTDKKFQLGKTLNESKPVIQNFDEDLEKNKDAELETFNIDVVREYGEYGIRPTPTEKNMSMYQLLISKESSEDTALRIADVIVKGPGTAEWKKLPWRQRLMAKKAREKAALRHAKVAAKKHSSLQAKCAKQLPEEQLTRLVQQTTGTFEKDTLQGTLVAATVEGKISVCQQLIRGETTQVASIRHFEAAVREPTTTKRQIPWDQRLLAKEALEKAALQRIEAAAKEPFITERKIPWRQRLIAKEALEKAALQRIEAAANKPPSMEKKIPWRQRLVAKETPEESALRRAKAAAQKQRSRQLIRARQTSDEREFQRLQDVSRIQQIRLRQLANESPEEAAERRAKAVAQKQRSRQSKRAQQSLKGQTSQCLQGVSQIPQTLTQEVTGTQEDSKLQYATKHQSAELHHSAISANNSIIESQVSAHNCDMTNIECQSCHSNSYAAENSVDATVKNDCRNEAVSNDQQTQEQLQFPVNLKDLVSQGFSNLLHKWNP